MVYGGEGVHSRKSLKVHGKLLLVWLLWLAQVGRGGGVPTV
jgi:hypothetical protein